ncbi:hypothetical protein FGKAn22_15520 [Ferrigenium kumadai]|uniref:Uncharacterized protein n=2 Tax=Ferrigenium kumadai TaxID=1682490 RepID=A0AAN1VZW8_9PROT|nr:hypothetical protein FGKAn22_15520 [Ferrigenium kumadai]
MEHASTSEVNNSGVRRLAWPFALSLLLHSIVLVPVIWNSVPSPASHKPDLTISLDSMSVAPAHRNQREERPAQETTLKAISRPPSEPATPKIEMPEAHTPPRAANHLDTSQLLSQAREYAAHEYHGSAPARMPNGDYYGTYTGDDSGTFFFHLNEEGHASGTGQSGIHGISFVIAGNATGDGHVQMYGKGMAGAARFDGQLNVKTREVTGTWSAAGIGRGSFAGRHE